jgi:hypothetical protein
MTTITKTLSNTNVYLMDEFQCYSSVSNNCNSSSGTQFVEELFDAFRVSQTDDPRMMSNDRFRSYPYCYTKAFIWNAGLSTAENNFVRRIINTINPFMDDLDVRIVQLKGIRRLLVDYHFFQILGLFYDTF